jgi:hypothetical protein
VQDNLDVLNEAAGISLSGVLEEASRSAVEVVARDASGDTVAIVHEPSESGDEGLGRPVASLAAAGGAWAPLRRRLQTRARDRGLLATVLRLGEVSQGFGKVLLSTSRFARWSPFVE